MPRYPYTFELKTPRGKEFSTVEAEIECEIGIGGKPSINAVFVDGENLFSGEMLHRALACAIAGEAESSPKILAALEDEAAEEFAEKQMRRTA